MKRTDTSERERIELKPRDWLTFEVLQRHGPLPSHYLHEFTKHLGRDAFFHRKRLYKLVQYGYLARPVELNHPAVRNDFKIYVLTDKAKAALREAGKLYQYAQPVGGGYQHMTLAALVTASIELETKKAGFRYIDQEEILSRAPLATRNAKHPLALPSEISFTFKGAKGAYTQRSARPTLPDQLFGIDYGGKASFFAVEIDRATEPVTRSNLNQNSYLRKILCYRAINSSRAYKAQWGVPNFIVLNVTVSDAHSRSILELVREVTQKPDGSHGITNFLFQVVPNFTHYTRVPPVMSHLWSAPWLRAGKEPFYISKP